jgi:hypothetical protein
MAGKPGNPRHSKWYGVTRAKRKRALEVSLSDAAYDKFQTQATKEGMSRSAMIEEWILAGCPRSKV